MTTDLLERPASTAETPRSKRDAKRAVTRLAARTARGGGWRHTLIVAMIALSVAVAAGVAVGVRSSTPTPEQRLTWQIGAADLSIELYESGGPRFTELTPEQQRFATEVYGYQPEPEADAVDILAIVQNLVPDAVIVEIETHHLYSEEVGSSTVIVTDVASPVHEGRWLVNGPNPGLGQVLLSPSWLRDEGASVGDRVELPGHGQLEVVGTIELPDGVGKRTALIAPETAGARSDEEYSNSAYLLMAPSLRGPEGAWIAADLDEAARQVPRDDFNHVQVISRDEMRQWAQFDTDDAITRAANSPAFIGSLVGALLLLQVAFVSAAAFATGTRRRLRELGVIGAVGGSPKHVRDLVIREGFVLGAAGATIGALVGLLGFVLLRPWLPNVTGTIIPGVKVGPLDLLAPAILGMAAAVVAAWMPARTAGRVPTTTALAGRVPLKAVPTWLTPAALATSGIGFLLLVAMIAQPMRGRGESALMGLGVVLAIVGVAALSIPLLGLVGRSANRLPALLRVVARDSDRQRSRSAAATAALVVVLLAPLVLAISLATDEARFSSAERTDEIVAVQGPTLDGHMSLPVDDRAVELAIGVIGEPVARGSLSFATVPWSPASDVEGAEGPAEEFDRRFANPFGELRVEADGNSIWGLRVGVTDDATLAMLGIDEAGRQAFADGRLIMITPDRQFARLTSTVEGAVAPVVQASGDFGSIAPNQPIAHHPAQRWIYTLPEVVGSHEAVAELGFDAGADQVLLDLGHPLTLAEGNDARRKVFAAGGELHHEAGYSASYAREGILIAGGIALLVALFIVGMTTALAATESDRDIALMTAVGAEPRLRRQFHGLQSTLHGLIAGALALPTAVLLYLAGDTFGGVVIPWLWLVAIAFGIPVLTGLILFVVMRSAKVSAPRRIA